MANTPPTELMYLTYDGNFVLDCEATVLECHSEATATPTCQDDSDVFGVDAETGTTNNNPEATTSSFATLEARLTLDRTVMHPQGGGQPTDTGVVRSMEKKNGRGAVREFRVDQVSIDRPTGVVTHAGRFILVRPEANDNHDDKDRASSSLPDLFFRVGERVSVHVDPAERHILSECHTAGHVVDAALAHCQLFLPSLKAYHFLDGSYVEYQGTIPPHERDSTLRHLQDAFQLLVEQDLATEIHVLDVDEADRLCNNQTGGASTSPVVVDVKPFVDPITQQVRVVTVAGYSCPCGGTHVRSTGILKPNRWKITGLKCKKNVLRVKYGYENVNGSA